MGEPAVGAHPQAIHGPIDRVVAGEPAAAAGAPGEAREGDEEVDVLPGDRLRAL